MSLTPLDIVILVCFIPALLRGLKKGFVDQLASILSLLIGSFLAFKFSSSLSTSLAPSFNNVDEKFLNVLCFAIIMAVVIVLIWLLGKVVNRMLNITDLSWMNRLLGLVFSLLTTMIILGILFSIFGGINAKFNIIGADTLQASPLYRLIEEFTSKILPYLKDFIKSIHV